MAKHTPGPLRHIKTPVEQGAYLKESIFDADGQWVASATGDGALAEQRATEIVQAINLHDEMASALQAQALADFREREYRRSTGAPLYRSRKYTYTTSDAVSQAFVAWKTALDSAREQRQAVLAKLEGIE